MQKMVVILKE